VTRDVGTDPATIPELMVVLGAIRRGGPGTRARLRRLDVPCRNNHRLAEVFQTTAGPVALGLSRSSSPGHVVDIGSPSTRDLVARRSRRRAVAALVTTGDVEAVTESDVTEGDWPELLAALADLDKRHAEAWHDAAAALLRLVELGHRKDEAGRAVTRAVFGDGCDL
jgi:hypothetical protein